MIPLGTERDGRGTARAVIGLIVANLLVRVLFGPGDSPERWMAAWAFDPRDPHGWNLLTYQFAHDPGSWLHLGGNMLFLWVFGRPIEAHVGSLRFLLLYLSGGVVAGLAHWATSSSPVIGASGSVAAVSGAFLALFPRSRVFVFFPLAGIVALPATVLIVIYVVVDLFGLLGGGRGGIAHVAHLGGYGWGLGLGLLSLRFGGAPRGETDLVFLLRQGARRRAMRKALREGSPWTGQTKNWTGQTKNWTGQSPRQVAAGPLEGRDREIAEARARVQAALRSADTDVAVREWTHLRALDPDARLPESAQLDLANRLYARGDPAGALTAYEAYLRGPVSSGEADPVRLLVASLRLRFRGDRASALELLKGLPERLHQPDQRRLAEALLAEASAPA
jgi:membrane associated rhomboid family serine protease